MKLENLNLNEDVMFEIEEDGILDDVSNFLETAHFRVIETPQLSESCFEDYEYVVVFQSDKYPEDDYSMRVIAESPLFPEGLMDEMECCYTYEGNLTKMELITELQSRFGFEYKSDVVNFEDVY